jgi:LCP family protein required for cell wall assembly
VEGKRAVILALLIVVAAIAGALLITSGATPVLGLPTLAPTIAFPTPSATPTPVPTLEPPTPTPVPSPEPTATFTPAPVAVATETAEPTATPTETPTPSQTPTFTLTPTPFSLGTPGLVDVTPTLSDTTAIPSAVPTVELVPGTVNIVVLGSDQRPDWEDWHTDVVQIVSIQPQVPAVTVLSIPRDLYIYVPGVRMSRINFADMYGEMYRYEGGGPGLIQQTLLYNLGIPVHHYVRTDFDGLIGIVDALGGVDIPVHCRLEDHWPYPDENGEYPIKVLEPGIHHMDGETALWYARSRLTSSVFARERRQQQVLQAIWRKGRSLDLLPNLPQLWEQFRGMIVTDMEFGDVAMLTGVAFQLDEQNVRFRNIGYQQVIPWTTPLGGSVFLPNWEEIEPVVEEALGPVPEGRLWRTLQTVEVWNGSWHESWDRLAADRLFREGFVAVIGQPDRRDYPQTQLIDFTGTEKGGAVPYLRWMFNISPENVISMPDAGTGASYRLIVGADYQSCHSP